MPSFHIGYKFISYFTIDINLIVHCSRLFVIKIWYKYEKEEFFAGLFSHSDHNKEVSGKVFSY